MKLRYRPLLAAAGLLAGLSLSAEAQVKLQLLKTVDLSATSSTGSAFIGSNPSAVFWDGTSAWLGGYNASAAAANTALVKISAVLTNPTIGTAFGALTTPASRGITSLTLKSTNSGSILAASLDVGTGGSGDAVRAFDTATGQPLWRIGDNGSTGNSTLRAYGITLDPGFAGSAPSGGNFALLSLGGGRRIVLNAATGGYLYSQSGGPAPNGLIFSGSSTTWRDLTFDPANGDLYARESNRVVKAVRTGDNTITGSAAAIGTLTTASGVDNQNLAFVTSTAYGNFLLFNDRTATSNNQLFSNVLKAFTTTGGAVSLDFGSFSAGLGNGAYDFSFDNASQTLALTDFRNRRLHIFALGEPGIAFGTLTLEGIDPGALARALTFEFRNLGEGPDVVREALVGPDGLFNFTDIPAGEYDVAIKGVGYLRTVVPSVSVSPFIDPLPVEATLRAGDSNDDNSADALDLADLISAFNTAEGDVDFNASADFNGDNSVDALDLALLITNFNVEGDL